MSIGRYVKYYNLILLLSRFKIENLNIIKIANKQRTNTDNVLNFISLMRLIPYNIKANNIMLKVGCAERKFAMMFLVGQIVRE